MGCRPTSAVLDQNVTVFRRRPGLAALAVTLVAIVVPACGDAPPRDLPTLPQLNGDQSVVYDSTGKQIMVIPREERRVFVSIDKIPAVMQNAIVAIEDQRFWEHSGVDIKGIARAATANSDSSGVSQGGSTITQQYVKTALLSPERTIERKIEEASLAIQLEKTYSKRFILEQYLNTIFFGNRSYGIEVAAENYFGHSKAEELTLPEAALLAGMVQAPTLHDPYRRPDDATQRRNLVLEKMSDLGYITPAERDVAVASPVVVQPQSAAEQSGTYPAPHFVQEVLRFIRTDERFGKTPFERENLLSNGGLQIYTTIDMDMQAKAEQAIKDRFPDQNRSVDDSRRDPDAALVSIEPKTGYVKAMVGGYDYFDTPSDIHPSPQYNLAMGTGRQVGSTFKMIELAAALSNGVKPTESFPAPGRDTVSWPKFGSWTMTGDALGRANLTECTVHSANTCFANLEVDKRLGPEKVKAMAEQLGVDTSGWKQWGLSQVLGTENTTVLDLASVYATFANRGVRVPPVMVTKVIRADGTVLYQDPHTQQKIIEPDVADKMTEMMKGVLTRGTARGNALDRPSAGKTGTTQDSTDALFVGYTPDLSTAIWTGFGDLEKPSKGYPNGKLREVGNVGGTIAAPIWKKYMTTALDGVAPHDFGGGGVDETTTTTTTLPKANTDIFTQTAGSTFVTMPKLVGLNVREAAARIKKLGLRLKRVDVSSSATNLPGQVVNQAPASGSNVTAGADIAVETTPGDPPPDIPVPDVTGAPQGDVVASLSGSGFKVTVIAEAAPLDFLLPNLLAPTSGQVWSISPTPGTKSTDGKVIIKVQP